jgi:hypothetical protein
MKKFAIILMTLLLFTACESEPIEVPVEEPIWDDYAVEEKPVIYLYPEVEMDISVKLDYKGMITAEYPSSDDGIWNILAQPDGTLTMKNRSYPYLFWEGVSSLTEGYEMTEGFVVANEEVTQFLEEKLTHLGLNQREQADFITYWMPRMTAHEWVKVSFLFEEYEEIAQLSIIPAPDSLIRVFMVFEEANASETLPLQMLAETPERNGFTVIEWGGSELN